jgi:hypothetical protein
MYPSRGYSAGLFETNEEDMVNTQDENTCKGNEELTVMNPFTEHTQRQGLTYIEHWCFAMGIAYRLLSSVVAFALHAIFPFIDIECRLDLEATAAFVEERNRWIEGAKERNNIDLASTSIIYSPSGYR